MNGFRGQYQSQSVSPLLAEAYATAAEKLTKKAFAGDTGSSSALPHDRCEVPRSVSDQLRTQVFRRPLTTPEMERYRKLFATGGARMVTEAMLQSPNFLLRTENGLESRVAPYETASRLSYFLWNSMPDEDLFRSRKRTN